MKKMTKLAALFIVVLVGGGISPVVTRDKVTLGVTNASALPPGYTAGTVKWFNDAKGFGFLTTESGEDVFVQSNAIVSKGFRSLQEGRQVEFIVGQGPKGPQAYKVHQI
jgi:cold shock protein